MGSLQDIYGRCCTWVEVENLLALQVMREGTDVTLVAFGKLVGYNLKVAEELEKEGISCEVGICVYPAETCNAHQHTNLYLISEPFLRGPCQGT